MTPKEQAVKLVLRYKPFVYCYMGSGMLSNTYDEDVALNMAKQCALIAVQFARQEFENHCAAEYGTDGSPDDHFDAIKQELEKL